MSEEEKHVPLKRGKRVFYPMGTSYCAELEKRVGQKALQTSADQVLWNT